MVAAVPRLRICVFALLFFLTRASAACAADQTITLKLGVPTAVALEKPFKSVLMGDPNIFDVHTINDREVTLEPLKLGATNLILALRGKRWVNETA